MSELEIFAEANRQLVICNACRYCEGYCAVFQAIVVRKDFEKGDVLYLANLCHDCRACFYACMYTPPHEFAINIPKVLAEARVESYRRWSWPEVWARVFNRQSLGVLAGVAAAGAALLLAVLLVPHDRLFRAQTGPGAFYRVVPYVVMLIPALALCVYGAGVWLRGAKRFWKESGTGEARSLAALARATIAAIGLRNLSGGGPGCYYPEEQPNQLRRIYHSLTMWGFMSTLVSTTLAYIYQDFLHWLPPYPVLSAPVLFGSIGGVGIIVGCSGLVWLKWRSDQAPADGKTISMDYVFLIMLALTALTGELTLLLRDTRAMGTLLVLHLGTVAGLFLTAPYGKFVHLVYRSLALVRHENEQQVERDRRLVALAKESR